MDRYFSSSAQEREVFGMFDSSNGDGVVSNLALADSSDKRPFQSILDEMLQASSIAATADSATVSTDLSFNEVIMQINQELAGKYPLIAIDNEVLGEPRLAGTRMAVSNVLTAFTIYDSIEEIIDEYEGRYTKKQLKDAVRFARDFLDSFYTS